MGSSVTLYKLKYNNSTVNKPYFETKSARENFFSRAVGSKVLENASVTQLENLEVEITVRVDISSFDYNYAVVKGQREYYLFIMDIRKMAFGVTTLRCKIDISTQLLDPFSKFNFIYADHISTNEFKFGKNYKVKIPDLNFYSSGSSLQLVKVDDETCMLQLFVFIKCTRSENDIRFFDGFSYTDYAMYCAAVDPYVQENRTNFGYRANETEIQTVNSIPFLDTLGNDITPRIINISYALVPVKRLDDFFMTPIVGKFSFENFIAIEKFINIFSNEVPHNEFVSRFDSLIYSYTFLADPLNKYEIRCFMNDNSLEIDPINFISDNDKNIEVNFTTIFSNQGTALHIGIRGNRESIVYIIPNSQSVSFDLNTSTSYTISAEASFLAENKYYDMETNTNLGFMGGKAMANFAGSLFLGLTQNSLGADIMGVSNIIRGITEAVTSGLDMAQYAANREILANRLKARPAENIDRQSPNLVYADSYMSIIFITKKPFDYEIQAFNRNKYITGYECALTLNKTEILEFVNEDKVYIRGEIVIDYPLTNTEIVELKNIFRNGVCWEFYN